MVCAVGHCQAPAGCFLPVSGVLCSRSLHFPGVPDVTDFKSKGCCHCYVFATLGF